VRDFRELKVWHKAHSFVLDLYRHSAAFPSGERYGLTSDLRKSATSIPSNIAEGCGRKGEKELSRFLSIAAGSASKSEYQLLLAHELGYLKESEYLHLSGLITEVKRMLYSPIQKLSDETTGRQLTADS
jgi:four helix bundle protein